MGDRFLITKEAPKETKLVVGGAQPSSKQPQKRTLTLHTGDQTQAPTEIEVIGDQVKIKNLTLNRNKNGWNLGSRNDGKTKAATASIEQSFTEYPMHDYDISPNPKPVEHKELVEVNDGKDDKDGKEGKVGKDSKDSIKT